MTKRAPLVEHFSSRKIGLLVEKEEEYVATAKDCNQFVWMKQMLKDIRIEFNELVIIHCDNTSMVDMYKNLALHSKTKHISIKYHMLREKVAKKE